MAVQLEQWLELIDAEYLRDFIVRGGAAVKFVVGNEAAITQTEAALALLATRHNMYGLSIRGSQSKLHMMHDLFFAISRQIDWENDAQRVVEGLYRRNGYEWPQAGEAVPLKEVADANRVEVNMLNRAFLQWLTAELMKDTSMAIDFRSAVTQLCLSRLATPEQNGDSILPVLQWLRGELRLLGPLKNASIFSKITRHNAAAMLRSLCRWLQLAGHGGLLLTIDIRHLFSTTTSDGMLRYSPAAVMDAYEVFRQLIDGSDLYERLLVVVTANQAFIGDDHKRSVSAYDALKMRIWDDVRDKEKGNPLASLVVIEAEGKTGAFA